MLEKELIAMAQGFVAEAMAHMMDSGHEDEPKIVLFRGERYRELEEVDKVLCEAVGYGEFIKLCEADGAVFINYGQVQEQETKTVEQCIVCRMASKDYDAVLLVPYEKPNGEFKFGQARLSPHDHFEDNLNLDGAFDHE